MEHDQTIDVVIPTYDRPEKLARAIASIHAQTIHPKSIIIVDNGCNPGTTEVVQVATQNASQKYVLQYLRSLPGSGRAALATGIEAAAADWIILLDDDDFLCRTRIEEDIRQIKKLPPSAVLIQHCFIRVDYAEKKLWTHTVDEKFLTLESALKMISFGPPPSCTLKRKTTQEHHPFDYEDGWFDYDLYASILPYGTAHAQLNVGYVMDDTRVKKRETTNKTKPAQATLLHFERHGHLAAIANVDHDLLRNHIHREVAFHIAKSQGILAFFGKFSKFVRRHPFGAFIGFFSSFRRRYFFWLPIEIRGSKMKSFKKASRVDPVFIEWIKKNDLPKCRKS